MAHTVKLHHINHTRSLRRRAVPSLDIKSCLYLSERAIRYHVPWTIPEYPGRERWVASALSRQIDRQTVLTWMRGRAPLPSWAARDLLAAMEARLALGAEIAADLRRYILERDEREADILRARAARCRALQKLPRRIDRA